MALLSVQRSSSDLCSIVLFQGEFQCDVRLSRDAVAVGFSWKHFLFWASVSSSVEWKKWFHVQRAVKAKYDGYHTNARLKKVQMCLNTPWISLYYNLGLAIDKPFLDLLRSRCLWVTRVIIQTDSRLPVPRWKWLLISTEAEGIGAGVIHREVGAGLCPLLIPLGYFVLCLEMKEHFDLRTRWQLTVGLWVPRCRKCWVCKPAPSHWNLRDTLLVSCRNPREEEREKVNSKLLLPSPLLLGIFASSIFAIF